MTKSPKLIKRGSKPTCFVMMPFAGEFTDVYRHLIKPAVEAAGYQSVRADDVAAPGPLFSQILKLIAEADLLIVDVSQANPNVFYELGIAHSLARPVIMVSSGIDSVPFDLRQYHVLIYNASNLGGAERFRVDLARAIKSINTSTTAGSPVADALPARDTVPRRELHDAQEELAQLKQQLATTEAQLKLLESDLTGGGELLTIRKVIAAEMNRITEEIIGRNDRSLVDARVELEKLRQERDVLQSAEREVRRLKQMTLVNPHWKGRDFEVESDLCFLVMPFREAWSKSVWKLIEAIVTK